MVNLYRFYKEEAIKPINDYPACYVFEGSNRARAADQNIEGLIRKCVERSDSDLRVSRGDIVTTLEASQIVVPLETKTAARFMRVPVTNKELSYFYRKLMVGIEHLGL